jgi:hypothetical protein
MPGIGSDEKVQYPAEPALVVAPRLRKISKVTNLSPKVEALK